VEDRAAVVLDSAVVLEGRFCVVEEDTGTVVPALAVVTASVLSRTTADVAIEISDVICAVVVATGVVVDEEGVVTATVVATSVVVVSGGAVVVTTGVVESAAVVVATTVLACTSIDGESAEVGK